uniref:Zinc finger protein 318 n=1 Tax=Hucho hucho TaxID=62062 RepID=A0A4W5P9L3_9TELE
ASESIKMKSVIKILPSKTAGSGSGGKDSDSSQRRYGRRSPSLDQFGRVKNRRSTSRERKERGGRCKYRRSRSRSRGRERNRRRSHSLERKDYKHRSCSRKRTSSKRSRSKERDGSSQRSSKNGSSSVSRSPDRMNNVLERKKRELEELNELIYRKRAIVAMEKHGGVPNLFSEVKPMEKTCFDYNHGMAELPTQPKPATDIKPKSILKIRSDHPCTEEEPECPRRGFIRERVKNSDDYDNSRNEDWLLPHERAIQEGGGFPGILGMMSHSQLLREPGSVKEEDFLYRGKAPALAEKERCEKPGLSDRYRDNKRSCSARVPVEETREQESPEKTQHFDKIKSLLQAIGLDLDTSEVTKLADRTQERLYKTKSSKHSFDSSERETKHSSRRGDQHRLRTPDDSDTTRFRSSSSRSDSHSPSRSSSHDNSRNRKKSPPSDRHSTHGKTRGGREVRTEDSSWGQKASQAPETTPVPPTHPSLSMPAYAQAHGLVPPNYPPPGYGQYGNWPYMPQQWPMYPPPSMGMPPQSPIEEFPNTPPFDRPYLKVIQPELHQGGDRKGENKLMALNKWMFNYLFIPHQYILYQSKVLEEREKLRRDREIRMKKKDYLMKELERLRKQQGELLRKKRREKDGHKDPLLSEISRLQEEVMTQIAELRKEHEVAEKKRSELDKVALILGLQPNDKPRREGRGSADLEQPTYPPPPEKDKKKERAHIREKSPKKAPTSTQPPETPADLFEYYDAGNHWCKSCNVTCGSMFDFFTHLHSKSHRKTQDPYNRPWASTSSNNDKNKIHSSGEKMTKPAKGSEFLVPVRGYYCQLCEEFCGDAICAEDHATSQTHNEKYKKRMYEYPLYEQRRNLDRQAGLTLEVSDKKHSELKRKHEEEESKKSKEKEEGKPKRKEKSGSRKQSEPEKPSDPPKVFCGPNPALRAKLRKKSEETAKLEPKAPSAFGKFSWKKKLENELAKEAERVAVEFLKEDEEEVEEDDDPDAFSKSLAAAKSIAIKLSGKTVISPTSAWVPFNSGKIRPNLPAPSTVLRKPSGLGPWVYAKPAPLNTFLSIRPPGDSGVTPLPVIQNQPKNDPVLAADIISKAFCGEEVDLKKSSDGTGKPGPTSTPDKEKASTTESFSQASTSTPSAVMPEFKTPLPPLTMMTMKSDVSAPGVPESEQNVPVMVTPPPFMQRPPSEVMNKSEKPKSNLAAAKAQDLFDIFYSSITTASTTSITSTATKAVVESKGETNDSKNSEVLATTVSQMEQTQPELPALDNSNTIETETQESETGSGFDPQVTKAVVESKAAPNDSNNSEALEATAPQTEQTKPEFPALDNSNTVETDTPASIKMESGFDPQATKAVVESKAAPNDSNNSEALEATAPQTEQTKPEFPALDNSNTIETNTQGSMETESGCDPQPKEETPEDAPVQLKNPSDSLGISTETLDLPTEVLGLDLFDFNLE